MTVIPEKPLRQAMGAVRVLPDELGSLAPFLFLQRLHALIREGLGARGSARFQDRREQAEELDARGPGQHDRSSTVPRQVPSARWPTLGVGRELGRPRTDLGIGPPVNAMFKPPGAG